MHLLEKLNTRSATIGIVGLGYVGLPLLMRYLQVGYQVIGFDIDRQKLEALERGESYIKHLDLSPIINSKPGQLELCDDFHQASRADALILCVPTPLDRFREPDLSFVINTVEALQPGLRSGQVVSLESTTYPGTTDEELLPRLEQSGLKVGSDLFLIYSPEREDPGNLHYSTHTIPKVIGGITEQCRKVGIALYEQVIEELVPVSSTRVAEMTKLLENIHRAVNIGLVNEMKMVADKMDIDIHEVINAAATKPFGFVPYYPGPGLGGHCIPIDPFYLTWKAREYGVNTRFIELAGEVNRAMPEWVVQKIVSALNSRKKSVNGSPILILGVAYKANIDDMRETPAAEIMSLLAEMGAQLSYSDPHVPVFPSMRNYQFDMHSQPITAELLAKQAAVVLVTAHNQFDYSLIEEYSELIVDSRGRFAKNLVNVVRA